MNRVRLESWLRNQLFSNRTEGSCIKLALRHVGERGVKDSGSELWARQFENGASIPDDSILEIVSDIETASFDDCEGLGGANKYAVLAYFQHSKSPLGRFPFRLQAADSDEDEVIESPTKQGLLGQLMRHNEAHARAHMFATNQVLGIMSRTIEQLASQNEHLHTERRKGIEVTEDLMSQRHERELMSLEAENKSKQVQAMFEKANILLPALVNRIAGKKILPEETGPVGDMLKAFAESLDAQQMAHIMKALRPEQQIAIVEFLQSTQKDKQLTGGNGVNQETEEN